MNVVPAAPRLKPQDYASDQEVRWCPGCGDYGILRAVQRTLAEMGAAPENTVFVSGIGCSSRFPYYLSTYGFHTIHGRAPAVATGIKLANPELDVWIATGDGDALSIGGNHLMHILRRNVDVQILLFNNEIYGLTKGQASPTSHPGTRSPSTPGGSTEAPVSAASLAFGAGARFVARVVDTAQKDMVEVLKAAHGHRGASFVEIFQNCIVYNDGVFAPFADKSVAADRQLHLKHGQPLLFGAGKDLGLRLKPGSIELEVVSLGQDGITVADVLVHDQTNRALANMLAAMVSPAMPMALGVLYCDPATALGDRVLGEETAVNPVTADFDALLRRGNTWTVTA